MTADEAEAAAQLREQAVAQRRRMREARRRTRVARLRLVAEAVAASWHFVLRDIGGLAGIGLLSFGAWQAYQPAGYIVAGALLLVGAWIAGSKDG